MSNCLFNGLRHAHQQFVKIGGLSISEKGCTPAIEFAARGWWLHISIEVTPIVYRVSERIMASGIVNVRSVELRRRMVEANLAYKAQSVCTIVEFRGRHVITENVARPIEPHGFGRNVNLTFENSLVFVIAREQHHPVLAERDRAIVVVRGDVFDIENRHRYSMVPEHATHCDEASQPYMHFLGQIECVFLPCWDKPVRSHRRKGARGLVRTKL